MLSGLRWHVQYVWSKKLPMTNTPALLSVLDGSSGSDPAFMSSGVVCDTTSASGLQAGGEKSHLPTFRSCFHWGPWTPTHPSGHRFGFGRLFFFGVQTGSVDQGCPPSYAYDGGASRALSQCYKSSLTGQSRIRSLQKERVSVWALFRFSYVAPASCLPLLT